MARTQALRYLDTYGPDAEDVLDQAEIDLDKGELLHVPEHGIDDPTFVVHFRSDRSELQFNLKTGTITAR